MKLLLQSRIRCFVLYSYLDNLNIIVVYHLTLKNIVERRLN